VLRSLLNVAGAGAVLLLEDVDAAFAKREAGENARHLTFSGMLRSTSDVACAICGGSKPRECEVQRCRRFCQL